MHKKNLNMTIYHLLTNNILYLMLEENYFSWSGQF